MERARRRYGSADYRAARGVMREVLVTAVNETYEAQLEQILQPVHLVWGADDTDVPVEIANRAMQHLENGQLTVLDGVGHHVCLEAPEAVRAAILGGTK
jgi:pimeloyl-ACP methyl ester carboxylesterase